MQRIYHVCFSLFFVHLPFIGETVQAEGLSHSASRLGYTLVEDEAESREVFFEHFRGHWETLWQPWGSRGTPLSPFFGPVGAILQPRGGIGGTTR